MRAAYPEGIVDSCDRRKRLVDSFDRFPHRQLYVAEPAREEYESTLKTNPGRFNALYGAAQAAQAAGKNDKAKEYYSQLIKNCDGSQSERAELKLAREEIGKLARN